MKIREVKPALALPTALEVTGIERIDEVLPVTMVSTQLSRCCPLCGVAARSVHSRFTRHVADLPCGGNPVRLLLQVRQYFCEESTGARKILVERLMPFVDPWARVTRRLGQIVQVIGLPLVAGLGSGSPIVWDYQPRARPFSDASWRCQLIQSDR